MRKKIIIGITIMGLLIPTNVNAENIDYLNSLSYTNTSITTEQELISGIPVEKYNELQQKDIDKYALTRDVQLLEKNIVSNIEDNKVKKSLLITNNIVIPDTNDYICIKKQPDEYSLTVAKLYQGSAATIEKYENDNWIKVKSGGIVGYIDINDVLDGNETQKYVEDNITSYQKQIYTNKNTPIGVYKSKKDVKKDKFKYDMKISIPKDSKIYIAESEESEIVEEITEEASIELLSINNEWAKVKYNNKTGYTKANNVNIECNKNKSSKAISMIIPGEKYDIIDYDEDYATVKLENNETGYVNIEDITITVAFDSAELISTSNVKYDVGGIPDGKQKEVVEYALQFLGNPYVWGGESLTKGVDCSGFTMMVMRHFGVNIPHFAASQAECGKEVKLTEVEPGDLVFYSDGSYINHVGIYIGENKLLHASNPRSGIKISEWCYRTPVKAVRLIEK